MTPEEIFVRRSVALARSLPMPESVQFLHGMLALCGDTHLTHEVRRVYIEMSHCDEEMGLIATGQMRLFPDPSPSGDGQTGK